MFNWRARPGDRKCLLLAPLRSRGDPAMSAYEGQSGRAADINRRTESDPEPTSRVHSITPSVRTIALITPADRLFAGPSAYLAQSLVQETGKGP
jgi:hypothetical protein